MACMLSTGRIVSNGSCSLNAKLANETHCLIRRPRGGKILPTFSTHTPPTADHFARVSRTTHSTLKGLPLSLVVPELSEIFSRKITIKCIFTEIFYDFENLETTESRTAPTTTRATVRCDWSYSAGEHGNRFDLHPVAGSRLSTAESTPACWWGRKDPDTLAQGWSLLNPGVVTLSQLGRHYHL